MKKLILVSIFFVLGYTYSFAQFNPIYSWDALKFSERNYDGTARSMAMGNAFTALGADMGALHINPASSGVFRYSEFSITPATNSSVVNSNYLGNSKKNINTRVTLNNIGYLSSVLVTGNKYGLRYLNLSISGTTNNNFNYRTSASGVNAANSWAASIAAGSEGYRQGDLEMTESNPLAPFEMGIAPWSSILAWNTFAIDAISPGGSSYVGITENIDANGNIYLGGSLNQSYTKEITGSNQEFTFNLGGNVSDKFFFGANLSIHSLNHYVYERYSESAVNPNDFDTKFQSLTYENVVNTTGVGFSMKAGIIYLPIRGLRLGASISTPTWFSLEENLESGITTYADGKEYFAYSPIGFYEYGLNTPFIWNIGAAYVLGNLATLSFDYESINYSNIHLYSQHDSSGILDGENSFMSQYFNATHYLRAGFEFKVHSNVVLRAGYNYISSPIEEFDMSKQLASVGIGYMNRDGFFIDLAYQQQCNTNDESLYIYNAYEGSGNIPEFNSTARTWKIALTVGARF